MKTSLGALAALLLLAAGGLILGKRLGLNAFAKRMLGSAATEQRLALRQDEAPFGLLAASQVGYAPGMVKQFSAPRHFDSFQVLDERTGAVALAGRGPVRTLRVEGLGPITEVSIGDFTGLTRAGRYRLVAQGGLSSHPFEVGPGVFDGPLRALQRVFYFQRAFTEIDAAHAHGPWVHPSDAAKAPPGVRKGWHDAGDFSLYSDTANTALFWMLEAMSDFAPTDDDTGIPESGNGIPDLLDEARWGLEWLLSVQEDSGGFRNTTCEESYGPYGSNSPQTAAPYHDGEVGTLATARAVGTLAYASTLYRKYDAQFAGQCLEAARRGEAYLRARPRENSDGPTCPVHRVDGDALIGRHVRMYAAAGMLLATGEARFRGDFERNYVELDYDPSYLHFNGFAAQLYLRAAAGDRARQHAILERLGVTRRTRAGRWRGAALRLGPAHALGFHWRRLHPSRLVQRQALPFGQSGRGRGLRAGARRRPLPLREELLALLLRQWAARCRPRATVGLSPMAGDAACGAPRLPRPGGWRAQRPAGTRRRLQTLGPAHSRLGLFWRPRLSPRHEYALRGAVHGQ